MRTALAAIAALAIAAPLARPLAAQGADPTKSVDAAPLPAGWVRVADPGAQPAKFITMGPGYHVTSGGAAIYYNPKDAQGTNPFESMANFRQTKKITGHGDAGEAYGLFIAGKNLDDPAKQTYYYFLVRQNGQFLINHRAGSEVHKIVDWTANPAIVKFDDKPNAANDLSIKVGADSVRFLVNNKQVHAIAHQTLGDLSGQSGVRVNHNLDVHIANFMVMK